MFLYKQITPCQYITNLETKWVLLDERNCKALLYKYKHSWEENEHIAAFATQLDKGQQQLPVANIVSLDADKKAHNTLEMWN